ncbi:MAG: co-chaperone DjlA [Gammaproteobacteria bacterium]|nr:co-chaperone DjlA [Gammaproteobacteria bacterium]MDD9897293.1 co-chaperone DjlA [Gammaproteobacteria bacterium]MDD9959461.1 co-chaperone DjlA [Gammaproteobacteria bacterium]
MLALLLNRGYKRAITSRLDGSNPHAAVPDGGRTQQIFLMAMFALMGKVAKLDGRVTSAEVKYASTIMQVLGLSTIERQKAINYFDQGKQPNADVLSCVMELAAAIGKNSALANLFLKIHIRHAFVKGELRLKEKVLLRDVAELLGFDRAAFLSMCNEMQGNTGSKQTRTRNFLHNAYRVLQLEPDVEDGEIRRAYLRMMSRYHPDKLVRDNLTEESLKQAQEKSMAIRTAYETVCGFRKIRA